MLQTFGRIDASGSLSAGTPDSEQLWLRDLQKPFRL